MFLKILIFIIINLALFFPIKKIILRIISIKLIKKIKNCHKFKGVFEIDLKAIEKIGQQAIDFSNTAYSQTHTPNLD